jgi:esterase/lipase
MPGGVLRPVGVPLVRKSGRQGVADLGAQVIEHVSRLKHRIQAPVADSQGEVDERVPPRHSKKLMKALDARNKPYEWVELTDEGHGIYYMRNRLKFSNALLQFLDKHIGSGAQQGNTASKP